MTPTLRTAVPADAGALAAFAEHTFRDWYAADNEPADLELHIARTYGPALQAAELADPQQTYLLACVGDRFAGYGLLREGSAHRAVAAAAPGEVRRFYVDRAHHGRGVAPALMESVFDHARARGLSHVWLTAWERNPRALAFYAKMGFADVGTEVFVLGASRQTDRVLVRRL